MSDDQGPPSTIFAALTSFADYPRMVDGVQAAGVYSTSTEAHRDAGNEGAFPCWIRTRGSTFDLHHSYNEALGQLTGRWIARRASQCSSPMRASGSCDLPTPNSSIVYYSIAEPNGWIPRGSMDLSRLRGFRAPSLG